MEKPAILVDEGIPLKMSRNELIHFIWKERRRQRNADAEYYAVRIEALIEEIGTYHRNEGGLELLLDWKGVVMDEEDWQALKSKYGVQDVS